MFRFNLFWQNPACSSSNGIIRKNGSNLPGYNDYGVAYGGGAFGTPDSTIKKYSRWSAADYVNVYLVYKITGNSPGGGGVGAYANYPGGSLDHDGIVIAAGQEDWAWAHEMGHFYGLDHTFSGSNDYTTCPDNFDCTIDGDGICDTDPHPIPQNCPSGINTCTGNSWVPIVNNCMNYSNCRDRFTPMQRDRMIYNVENYRTGHLTSLGAVAPGTTTAPVQPLAGCKPTGIENANNNYEIGPSRVELSNLDNKSAGYTYDGYVYYQDYTISSCTQLAKVAELETATPFTLSVTIGGYNAEYAKAWIDYNNNGQFETSELVLSKQAASPGETLSQTFTVKNGAILNTNLRMRVISDFDPISLPCDKRAYGQVEDYIVHIGGTTPTNSSPTFENGQPGIALCENDAAILLSTTLKAIDPDNGQNLTWFIRNSAAHGSLMNFPKSKQTNGGSISPDNVSYSPAAGFYGTDSFEVGVTDGTDTTYTTINVKVNKLPVVSINSIPAVCSNKAPFSLALGQPSGGSYSGTGMFGNEFRPEYGTQEITYTYTDQLGCKNAAKTTITVNPVPAKPTVTFSHPNLVSSSASNNQWFLDGNPVSGATQQQYKPLANGEYVVVVTNEFGCSNTSMGYNFTGTGIANLLSAADFNLYPNPVESQFTIVTPVQVQYEIVDLSNRKVASGSLNIGTNQIDASALSRGTYLVQLKNEKNLSIVLKVVKQ